MIYPKLFEEKIEFNKIRELLNELCLSNIGKDYVASMQFMTDIDDLNLQINCVNEFKNIIEQEEDFPTTSYYDMRNTIKRIRVEGLYLDEHELFELVRSIETIQNIVKFFSKNEEIVYPYLHKITKDTNCFPDITKRINNIINKFGRLKDNASPKLLDIRKEISSTQGRISGMLNSILKSLQFEGLAETDITPTYRDGRLVIPINPSHKRKIKGIIHDESASGKTIYIEPESVVETNNRIYELQNEEKREIVKILTDTANFIRPYINDLLASYNILGLIDFIRAKALFAVRTESVIPDYSDNICLEWYQARHPLLQIKLEKQHRKIVPLNIKLSEENRILVISGPNAGGKSVCLKSTGLIQYMFQCGMLVPMQEHSKIGIFKSIFIDIGDEQSIENDLSTYSSHLTNMKNFVKNCDKKSLILIDEFGSGTEPQIGGAIAETLLDEFNQKGSWGIITTHYTNLKLYAEHHKGTINGAMLYDRHEMKALFQLEIGNAGSSFAIEIARKIGLPEEIIKGAESIVGKNYINIDKYLQDIVRDKQYWERKRQNIHKAEKQLEETLHRYENELSTINTQKKEIIHSAKHEAKLILDTANSKIENTIRKIKETQADKEYTQKVRKELEEYKKGISNKSDEQDFIERKIEKLQNRGKKKEDSSAKKEEKIILKIGDWVKINPSNTIGEIIEISNNKACIAVGQIKTYANLKQLEKTNRKEKREIVRNSELGKKANEDIRKRKLNFKTEIDIRGMRSDEALQALTYFIDDAIMVGVGQIRVLHGTGTGALRQLTRDYAASLPEISSYHDEHVQFGGAGITIIEF